MTRIRATRKQRKFLSRVQASGLVVRLSGLMHDEYKVVLWRSGNRCLFHPVKGWQEVLDLE
ncbi:hypothetical protein K443DRAFT_679671 [Laccaria amethystina LaAM-08-1]|jgi:hypothetical protein|uniref:Unplaced genomic scaffold K443scaffold_103, whole genome shotgun sequence n=1 Tax=Laccaria amethystina LaAM-08-1 TaxID=1095629 RepID=A0A0C9XDZ4_9AGAR|nr:hypothetical protein K443DRAFT_679671 [Laccaria amethystina LaAM-08-1]